MRFSGDDGSRLGVGARCKPDGGAPGGAGATVAAEDGVEAGGRFYSVQLSVVYSDGKQNGPEACRNQRMKECIPLQSILSEL